MSEFIIESKLIISDKLKITHDELADYRHFES